jgi:hypothetical protein
VIKKTPVLRIGEVARRADVNVQTFASACESAGGQRCPIIEVLNDEI